MTGLATAFRSVRPGLPTDRVPTARVPGTRPGGGCVQGPCAERKGADLPLAGLPCATVGRSPLSRSRMTPVVRKARRQPDVPCRLPVPMPVADEADNPAGTFCRNRLARSGRPLCLAGRGARKPPFQTSQSGGPQPRSGDPEATFPGRLARRGRPSGLHQVVRLCSTTLFATVPLAGKVSRCHRFLCPLPNARATWPAGRPCAGVAGLLSHPWDKVRMRRAQSLPRARALCDLGRTR